MYEDLVKRLRAQAVYLPEKFSKNAELLDVLMKAADAIEELSRDLDSMNDANVALFGALPKWIPVTERLPDDRQSVLVHRDDGGIFIFEYFTTSPTDECWIDDHLNVYSAYSVTHWMPLPEPPEEGE